MRIVAPESARPLYAELHRAVWRAGGHALGAYQTDDDERVHLQRDFLEMADEAQLEHFPARYMRGLVDEMDHQVSVIADSDPHSLDSVDPARIMRRGEVMRPLLDWRTEKENAGRFTWTLGALRHARDGGRGGHGARGVLGADHPRLLPRPGGSRSSAGARSGGAWSDDPRAPRRARHRARARGGRGRRSAGDDRRAAALARADAGATSRASRSSPAPTGAAPRAGSTATSRSTATATSCRGVRLAFRDGRVVEASAEENERVLTEMIATEGADRVGEFSLTDRRFSRITRFMAHTLYDENVGGSFGNTHIAVGRAYQDAYAGDPATLTPERLERARLQQLERAHRRRLHERSARHRDAARRRRARDLRARRVPARLGHDHELAAGVAGLALGERLARALERERARDRELEAAPTRSAAAPPRAP